MPTPEAVARPTETQIGWWLERLTDDALVRLRQVAAAELKRRERARELAGAKR